MTLPLLATLVSHLALAYETDQLTDRALPLADALTLANEHANVLIGEAVSRTNTATACKGSLDEVRAVLGRELAELTARKTFIPDRQLAGFGYGAYAAWLETAPIDRRTFLARDDIYGTVRPGDSVVLAAVGTASTIRLAGVRMGTDKPDHFWELGYQYAVRSDWGRHPSRAVRWGTMTERTFYGLLTSQVFSYADLSANFQGWVYYTELLSERSDLQRGADGCVEVVRPFDWRRWVSPAWDEVLNPSVMNRRVDVQVAERIEARRERYCADYPAWREDWLHAWAEALAAAPPYAAPRSPTRRDPYHLEIVCAPEIHATPGPTPTGGAGAAAGG